MPQTHTTPKPTLNGKKHNKNSSVKDAISLSDESPPDSLAQAPDN
jgi:hypothetical protein